MQLIISTKPKEFMFIKKDREKSSHFDKNVYSHADMKKDSDTRTLSAEVYADCGNFACVWLNST